MGCTNLVYTYKVEESMNNEKTKQLLAYILKKQKESVTSLMKLSYLIDLVHVNKESSQVTDFEYLRYNFGPFDRKIYLYIEDMTESGLLIEDTEYTYGGEEFITYKLKEGAEISFDELKSDEIESVDEVTEELKGYGARDLTEVAYKTKPMIALGATLGGDENIGVKLDLNAS